MRTVNRRPLLSRTGFLASALVLLGTGCSNVAGSDPGANPLAADRQRVEIPTTAANIRGTITVLQAGLDSMPRGGSGSPDGSISCPPDCGTSGPPVQGVLIEETPGSTGGDEKSYVTVLKSARLIRQTASGAEPVAFADLKVGQRVDAWFTGPVRLSYPTQAEARVIVILDQ